MKLASQLTDKDSKWASLSSGVSIDIVTHFIDRLCKWEQPPHDKKEWKLKDNPWRKRPAKQTQRSLTSYGGEIMSGSIDSVEIEGLSKQKMR